MTQDMMHKQDWLNVMFASDNQLGIPTLLLDLQAPGIVAPMNVWGGRVGRTKLTRIGGTVCFYTEDYRFEALLKDPLVVANGNFACAVEPNLSVFQNTAPAVAAYQTYRKRYTARLWQEHGVRILVDMNVAPEYAELNLVGVPKGWRSYATRGYTDRLQFTEREYMMAVEHAGSSRIVFVVYGGGKKVREACLANGWTWYPEDVDAQKDRANAQLGPLDGFAQALPSSMPDVGRIGPCTAGE